MRFGQVGVGLGMEPPRRSGCTISMRSGQEGHAAVSPEVTERDWLESLVLAWGHLANKSVTSAAILGMAGSGSINVASSSLARELFRRLRL